MGKGVLDDKLFTGVLVGSHAFHTADIAVIIAGSIPSNPSLVSFSAGDPRMKFFRDKISADITFFKFM